MNWLLLALAACAGAPHVATVADPAADLERARRFPEALAAYARACDAGRGPACTRAGEFYVRGRGTKVDEARAEAFFVKACALHDGEGCERAAAPKDSSFCQLDTCDDIPLEVVPPTRHAEACDAGVAQACLWIDPPRVDRAVELGRAACRQHDPMGCLALANALHSQRPHEVQAWVLPSADIMALRGRAYDIQDRECDAGVPDACRDAFDTATFIAFVVALECGQVDRKRHHDPDIGSVISPCYDRSQRFGGRARAANKARAAAVLDCAAGDGSACKAVASTPWMPRWSRPYTYCGGGSQRLCDYWPEWMLGQAR